MTDLIESNRIRRNRTAWACALALAAYSPTAQTQAGELDTFHTVRELDQRLASVLSRLAENNANLCRQTMPLTGMVLHAQGQYNKAMAAAITAAGGFPTPVAIEVVLPGSPAELAGLRQGDGLLSINGRALTPIEADAAFDSTQRDSAESLLTSLSPTDAITLGIRRTGMSETLAVTFYPKTACRTRWEVTFDKATLALSDGKIIQISSRLIQNEDDDALAVIAAHELAHTALGHRESLDAAGAGSGVFAAYGRSGKLVRAAEDEADRYSVTLLQNAGYDPGIAVTFWRGPGARYSGGILRSPTHASAKSRAKAIADEIKRLNLSP